MLVVASFGLLAAFLLSIELSKFARHKPALVAAALLCVSPVFFAQSMLAQLDAPAMLLTALALLWFLQNRMALAGAACLALTMTKETGLIAPLVFAGWLACERRWREMIWFAPAALALGGWAAALKGATGYWTGNPDFLLRNLILDPSRIGLTLIARLYYLFVANLHWVGTAAIVYAWRKSSLFQNRSWRVAWLLVAAHVILFSFTGGAALNRYLLPALPIVYAAMAASLMEFPRIPRIAYSTVLVAGLAASNLINPPYPFPLEDNLAFTDFVRVQRDAAGFLARNFGQSRISTVWPLTAELANPDLGYVRRGMAVRNLHEFSSGALERVDWSASDVLVLYSRAWNPARGLLRWGWVRALWTGAFGPLPDEALEDVRSRIPFAPVQRFELGGQWVEVYATRRWPFEQAPPQETGVHL